MMYPIDFIPGSARKCRIVDGVENRASPVRVTVCSSQKYITVSRNKDELPSSAITS